MANGKPVLYTYFRSSCSWRVRIALAFKNIDHDKVYINLLKGDQLSKGYMDINPSAEVPAFDDGKGNLISHSVAILEFLEETVPEPRLLPEDPAKRAVVRGIVDSIVAGIQPLQNMRVLKKVGEDYMPWAAHWLESGFESLERTLHTTHGTYCVGDHVTLADVCLVPQVFNASRFKVDVSKFPLIKQISDRLLQLEPFKLTHPYAEEDCPEDLKLNWQK